MECLYYEEGLGFYFLKERRLRKELTIEIMRSTNTVDSYKVFPILEMSVSRLKVRRGCNNAL